jgi:hypothetical protein
MPRFWRQDAAEPAGRMPALRVSADLVRKARLWLVALTALLSYAAPLSAHVGSPNTFFDGNAGPYSVRVVVKQPGVVPGLADITVHTGAGVTRVAVKPVKWDIGEAGSPPADDATRIGGDATAWAANLWLMTGGSYSIYVDVDGAQGHGRAIVPVTAMATKVLPMPPFLGAILIAMGALLVVGAVSLVGAGAREAVVPPGENVDASHRRKGRIALVAGFVIVLALVARGKSWWGEVDREYRQRLFKPLHIITRIDRNGVLDLFIDDPQWQLRAGRFTPIMPDHGKLMHLFLIREDETAIAHLHPQALTRDHFRAAVPSLPAGHYRVFADITHESGYAQTLVDRVDVSAASPTKTDADDAVYANGRAQPVVTTMTSSAQLTANRAYELGFLVRDQSGKPAALEPYMGMLGHAVIVSDDFSLFVHLHPMGSVSMASQMKFAERDKVPVDMRAMMPAASSDGVVSFPFEFPRSGRYHVWVQTKVNGAIVTGAFVVNVS